MTGTLFSLDVAASTFIRTRVLSFRIRLGCDRNESCVADGDSIETIFEVAEAGSGSQLSAVRMTTLVESMVSCENTRVFFSDEAQITAVEASRSIELVLEALDADMMPLRFTAVAISCSFGEKPCIVAARTSGKHLYAISVPSDFTRGGDV